MGLKALQHDFGSWLAGADESGAGRLPLADRRGLGVYQNNYRGALMACLEESYPRTLAWIGHEAFQAAAAAHIDHVPPRSWTLDDYARGLPATLEARYPRDPEVIELARLELALAETFVAPDAIPLTVADLSAIAWDEAILKLVPSASFLALATNAAEIWLALDAGREVPAARVWPGPATLIIWRHEFTCCFQPLDTDENELLPHLAGGLRFEAICEYLVQRRGSDGGVQLAGELLARWTQADLLARPME